MPDPRFFKAVGAVDLTKIATVSDCQIADSFQTTPLVINGVASLDDASKDDLTFFDNVKYKSSFQNTNAGACIVHPKYENDAPDGVVLLFSDNPYKSYAKAASYLYLELMPEKNYDFVSENIHPDADVSEDCVIEKGAVVLEGAVIGSGSWIEAGAVIGRNVSIGSGCRIGTNASISHALIGNKVHIYPGVRIGQDGFGFAIDPAGYEKVPQLGRVIIEDNVHIGANTTIDRGTGPDTVIGEGTWIDNLVQIAHNVKIGKRCVIVSQVGISGSTVLEDYVVIGGQVGIAGHLRIGMGARIAAQSGIMKDIPAGEEHMGSPSMPIKKYMRQVAFLKGMIHKGKQQD